MAYHIEVETRSLLEAHHSSPPIAFAGAQLPWCLGFQSLGQKHKTNQHELLQERLFLCNRRPGDQKIPGSEFFLYIKYLSFEDAHIVQIFLINAGEKIL